MSERFRIGLARELLNGPDDPAFGRAPLAHLDSAPNVQWEWLGKIYPEYPPELGLEYDALYVNAASVTRNSVALAAEGRLKALARHGVGYDAVDITALNEAGVILLNTPLAIRRPVATMAITFVLALAQRLLEKDRLTRAGRWNERASLMGKGLTGRTLGVIGGGGVGKALIPIARMFDLAVLVADPHVPATDIEPLGARLVPLDELLVDSDFVVVACLLNEQTRHLVNAARLGLMKPSAYLVNVARGPIVDESALIAALRTRQIAGAALDVFEQEPVQPDNSLLSMDNVIVTPHALSSTDECFGGIATEAFTGLAKLASGELPPNVVNREVLAHPRVRRWLAGARDG